ncbi:sugar ABC transporter permease, partial [Streptomyces coelicoflavus]
MATSTTKALAGGEPPRPSPRSGGGDTPRRRGALWHRLDIKGAPYAFVAPFFIIFAAFSFYPLIYTSWISLHDVELATLDVMEWVAFDNYVELWGDSRFWNALQNT